MAEAPGGACTPRSDPCLIPLSWLPSEMSSPAPAAGGDHACDASRMRRRLSLASMAQCNFGAGACRETRMPQGIVRSGLG
jgi:hypothetical protein